MKKKSNNKGFTLVELIVVLVILAILAAILVPALLGYIDRAKNQQIVLNARSAYTAIQAELSSAYGTSSYTSTSTVQKADVKTAVGDSGAERIATTADVTAKTNASVSFNVKGTTGHDAFTVKNVLYTQDGKTVYLENGEWKEGDSTTTISDAIGTIVLYDGKTTGSAVGTW